MESRHRSAAQVMITAAGGPEAALVRARFAAQVRFSALGIRNWTGVAEVLGSSRQALSQRFSRGSLTPELLCDLSTALVVSPGALLSDDPALIVAQPSPPHGWSRAVPMLRERGEIWWPDASVLVERIEEILKEKP